MISYATSTSTRISQLVIVIWTGQHTGTDTSSGRHPAQPAVGQSPPFEAGHVACHRRRLSTYPALLRPQTIWMLATLRHGLQPCLRKNTHEPHHDTPAICQWPVILPSHPPQQASASMRQSGK
jgi:hypothetical protein